MWGYCSYYYVDSTVTARMKRSKVIDNANIKAGDVIVGLASLVSQPMRKVIMAVWKQRTYICTS
jgi:hypothetical protein